MSQQHFCTAVNWSPARFAENLPNELSLHQVACSCLPVQKHALNLILSTPCLLEPVVTDSTRVMQQPLAGTQACPHPALPNFWVLSRGRSSSAAWLGLQHWPQVPTLRWGRLSQQDILHQFASISVEKQGQSGAGREGWGLSLTLPCLPVLVRSPAPATQLRVCSTKPAGCVSTKKLPGDGYEGCLWAEQSLQGPGAGSHHTEA